MMDEVAVIHTAPLSYGGKDRLDVTRQGNDPFGVYFAPSWEILGPIVRARKDGLSSMWEPYATAYVKEMRQSYRRHRAAWDQLLAEREVTLVCFCSKPENCHRSLLADILRKLGATVCGERPANEQRRSSVRNTRKDGSDV